METQSNSRPLSATPPEWLRYLTILSALAAIGVHAYLLKGHYEINFGEIAGKLLCDFSANMSCSAASASRYSSFAGVPMALWGILVNLGFVLLAAWDSISSPESRANNRVAIVLLAGLLVVASVVMGAISAVALSTICPFCALTYILSFVTAFGAWKVYSPGLKVIQTLRTPWKSLMGPILLGGFLLVGGFISNDIVRSSYVGTNGDAMAKAALSEWQSNPVLEIAETDPLTLGPERSKAKLVLLEFADFRCIHCKMASQPLKAFLASHPDTRLEYYSWPLDGECNTSIQQNNGASCLLARAVWCARKKADKGWAAHEKVFERFEEWRTVEAVRQGLPSLAQEIGMSEADLVQCSDSEDAKAAITQQARLGTSLNLKGTPTIYANGRLLPAGSQLQVLKEVHRSL